MKEIEDAFSTVTGLVLQKKLSGLDNYANWLKRNVGEVKMEKSA